MQKKTKSQKRNFDNIQEIGFEYFFWGSLLFFLCILNFPEFKLDTFHIVLSIIIIWMILGLYFTNKYAKVDAENYLPKSEIKKYLNNRFSEIYFIGSEQTIIVAYIKDGFLFSRKKMNVIIKKDSVEINIKTLGRFDIPSIFHSLINYMIAKNIAQELNQK